MRREEPKRRTSTKIAINLQLYSKIDVLDSQAEHDCIGLAFIIPDSNSQREKLHFQDHEKQRLET